MTRQLRVDAERNRQRIVEAARAAFAADGLEVPIRDIARRADVAPATIYRHFATRAVLVHIVLIDHVTACSAELQLALDDPDPGRALRTTIENFARRQVHDRGINEALLSSAGARGPFAAERRAHARAFAQLVDRARASGDIRSELSVDDVRAGLIAIASLGALPAARAATTNKRLVKLVFTGLRP
jgi:AcrR family transcriptional regulator